MFQDFFSKIRRKQSSPNEAPSHWVKCNNCSSLMYYKEVEACYNVCPKCGYHMRLSQQRRIELLVDDGSFIEFDKSLRPVDPLRFVDKKSYKKRISESEEKSGKTSAVMCGSATIDLQPIELVVFDFSFMGGSLSSVEGEKITRSVKRAIEKRCSVIIVSASGGARMQESTFSLMQMSKTSAALKLLSDSKLPFISILTDPTMGGVSASLAWLGDLIIAEPGALIGFAGQRVIEQTIKASLPDGFQRAEFLLEHGLIDAIIPRAEHKKYISDMIKFFMNDQLQDTSSQSKEE